MSRTWIRNATLVAAAATGMTGVLGTDLASGLVTPAQGTPAITSVTSSGIVLSTRGTPKARPIESARLHRQHAEASRRAAERRLAEHSAVQRQASADRVSRSTRGASPSSARRLGRRLAARHGWKSAQFSCLNSLWTRESGWRRHAHNPSGAYGIPQALPGTRMSTSGRNWRNSASTQIRWGLHYIDARYGSPCGAWHHWRAHHWY